jgi:DNA helicase-2/ATP-dependent DNA helicase PcrA
MKRQMLNATLETYLENVSLISDIDSYSKDDNAVTLATIHSVKGLEFNNVFIVGLEKKDISNYERL